MREIKFRAWDKGHNKMSYKVNLYSMNNKGIMDRAQIDMQQAMRTVGFDCEVMQFIGLQDLNGVEIYEGDLVKDTNGKIREVKFLNGIFCMCRIGTDFDCLPANFNYETIGNIYENPELLTNGQNPERSVASKADQGGDAGKQK